MKCLEKDSSISWLSGIGLLIIVGISLTIPLKGLSPGIWFVDEMFYLTGAWTLVEHGSLSIPSQDILDEGRASQFCVPGRHDRMYSLLPVGFSFVLAPLYWIGGWRALLNANLIVLPVTVLLLYRLLTNWFGRYVALLGTVLFAVSPTVSLFSTMVMNHLFAFMVQIVGMLFMVTPHRIPSKIRVASGGCVWGLGLLVRMDFILMLVPLVIVALFPLSESIRSFLREWRQRVIMVLVALAGWGVGASAHFGYQKVIFGEFFRSGYNAYYDAGDALSVSRIPAALPRAFVRIQKTGLPLTAAAGTIGLIWLLIRKPRAALHLGSWGIPFFGFYLMFIAGTKHDFNLRYYLPVFPLLTTSAAYFVSGTFWGRWRTVLIPVFVIAAAGLNLKAGNDAIMARNQVYEKQMEVLNRVETQIPSGATVFLPHQTALLMVLKGSGFDIRSSDYLLGPHSVPPMESDDQMSARPFRNPRMLSSNSQGSIRKIIPGLLPRLLREGRKVVVVCHEDRSPQLIDRYGVSLSKIDSVESAIAGKNLGIYQVIAPPVP